MCSVCVAWGQLGTDGWMLGGVGVVLLVTVRETDYIRTDPSVESDRSLLLLFVLYLQKNFLWITLLLVDAKSVDVNRGSMLNCSNTRQHFYLIALKCIHYVFK